MTGTFINAAAIIAGAVVGMLIKRGIPASVERGVTRAQGLAVGLIGLNGVIAAMFTVDADGTLSDSGGLLLLVSLVLGSLVGELIRIDDRLLGFGKAIEGRINIEGFAQGFISASIITCVGAMSIVGALNDGLMGDSQVLIVKSTLDFVTCHPNICLSGRHHPFGGISLPLHLPGPAEHDLYGGLCHRDLCGAESADGRQAQDGQLSPGHLGSDSEQSAEYVENFIENLHKGLCFIWSVYRKQAEKNCK